MSDQQQEPVTQKKGITFNSRVSVRRTIHVANYTEAEIEACWFTSKEYNEIRTSLRDTLLLVEEGKVTDDCETFCRRGLECFSKEGMDGRRRRRTKAKFAVFDEQDRQFDQDEEMDDEKIGKAYRKRNKASRDIALIIGLVDERVSLGESVQAALLNNLFSIASDSQKNKTPTKPQFSAKDMKSPMGNNQVIAAPVATRMMPSAA
ncbi:MAG: hypothetical protein SGILL_002030 [Bacillariaceae sp.]